MMNDWYSNLQIAEDRPKYFGNVVPPDTPPVKFSNYDESPTTDRIHVQNTNNTTGLPDLGGWNPFNPPYALRMPRALYSGLAVYMAFILFFAVALNGLVLYTAYKNRVIRTPLNYIVINLTAADFFGAMIGDTLSVMANIASGFFLGKAMCVTEGFTASVCGVAALMSVAVMAFERYFVVCKPFGPVHFSSRHAAAGVIFSWVYSSIWHAPMLLFWNGFEAEGFGTNCAPNYWLSDPGPRGFLILYFFGCFVFPFTAIFFSYGKLIMSLRQMKKESMVTSTSNVSTDQEVTKMVVAIVLAFVICWCPYAVVAMVNVISEEKIYWMGAFPAFFAKSAAVYNPVIYIGLNKQLRDCVMKTLFKGILPRDDNASMMSSQVSSNKVQPAP